jgi:hypothetical protein
MEMRTQAASPSPVAIGIRFGLLIALAGVLVDFLTRIIGLSVLVYSAVAGGLSLVVAIVGIVLAHKAFKKANAGSMTYVQGVVIALLMLLISGIFTALFNYLYVNYIDAEFVTRMKEEMTAFMERNNVPDDQIAKSTAKFDEMSPSFGMALVNGLKNGLIAGTLLGVIISAFTKRKPVDFD